MFKEGVSGVNELHMKNTGGGLNHFMGVKCQAQLFGLHSTENMKTSKNTKIQIIKREED